MTQALPHAVRFTKQVIDPAFVSEGIAVADINQNGILDIIAGDCWYEGPHWTPHNFRTVGIVWEAYRDETYNWALDLTGNGYPDLVTVAMHLSPIYWYENPGPTCADGTPWKKHLIAEGGVYESVAFADINGDGRPELIATPVNGQEALAWFEPAEDLDAPWIRHDISPIGGGWHGIGAADITGNGRLDILATPGWFEAPEDPRQPNWIFHRWQLGEVTPFQIVPVDFTGNGLLDLLTASPHNYGIWWWEQLRDANGTITWRKHTIDDSFSQSHAVALVDLTGNGLLDIVTGKRWQAHGEDGDPGSREPAVLVWYEQLRDEMGTHFLRHVIDMDSGVGLQVLAQDINNDGRIEIIASNKKGVNLFMGAAKN
ncbi:MAG TPA: VCBS repeat-containing protein [Armatimonadota bacterium]|jgi:hypothetical protein